MQRMEKAAYDALGEKLLETPASRKPQQPTTRLQFSRVSKGGTVPPAAVSKGHKTRVQSCPPRTRCVVNTQCVHSFSPGPLGVEMGRVHRTRRARQRGASYRGFWNDNPRAGLPASAISSCLTRDTTSNLYNPQCLHL